MSQHKSFVMSTRIRSDSGRGDQFLVMCRACGFKRPKLLAVGPPLDMIDVSSVHNASTIMTNALGRAV